MKKVILILGVIWSQLYFSTTGASEIQPCSVSYELQRAYEHFFGESLSDAIKEINGTDKVGFRDVGNGVWVRFNGRGVDDCLYIGFKNTLEFLFTNDVILRACSLGFLFSCSGGEFNWVNGYGDFPDSMHAYIKIHPEAFEQGGAFWVPNITIPNSSYDSITLGGVTWVYPALPPHDTPAVIYSMQIQLSDDPDMAGEEFSIDNIIMRPGSDWIFTDYDGYSLDPPPTFQGEENTSSSIPDAPPVVFPIVDNPQCDPGKSSVEKRLPFRPYDKSKEYFKIEEMQFDSLDYIRNKNGRVMVVVEIYYIGDCEKLISDLKSLDKSISVTKFHDCLPVLMPLDLLPKISLIQAIRSIESSAKTVPTLNYSTDTSGINCNYIIMQDSLNASGEGVILGIIDTGIDWLHGDFIDSNGNTRILFHWDQTVDSSASPPYGFSYIDGSEFNEDSINLFIIVWDGTNDNGTPVVSGIYFCQCTCNGNVQSKKMALLK